MKGEACAGNDLLYRLSRSREEDFFTEALCWLLDHTGFGARFLNGLSEAVEAKIPDLGVGCRWTTQRRYNAAIPDMVCESSDGNTALIFEHKVEARLSDGQLSSYRRIGKENYEDFCIVLITATIDQCAQEPDCHLLWQHVHDWLSDWLGDECGDDVAVFVARSFLVLLERHSLGFTGVTVEQLKANPLANKARSQLEALINRVAEQIWKNLGIRVQDRTVKIRNHLGEGRHGFYVLGDRNVATWTPAVYVGVMHHAGDHGPPSVDDPSSTGPVACVVVDVDKAWHGRYEPTGQFSNLLKAVRRQWPGSASDDWKVHEEKLKEKPNPWHPIAIYKPLVSIIEAVSLGGQQAEEFVEDVGDVARTLVGLEEFDRFRRLLRGDPAHS